MCLFIKFHLQGSCSPKTRSLQVVNEQFSDKRNAANGTLWTNTKYTGFRKAKLIIKSHMIKTGPLELILFPAGNFSLIVNVGTAEKVCIASSIIITCIIDFAGLKVHENQ